MAHCLDELGPFHRTEFPQVFQHCQYEGQLQLGRCPAPGWTWLPADYTAEDHLFRLYTVEDGEKGSEILAIRASSSISPGESNFDLLTTAGNIYYEVRIAQDEPYDLNVQRVQYMFTVLSD